MPWRRNVHEVEDDEQTDQPSDCRTERYHRLMVEVSSSSELGRKGWIHVSSSHRSEAWN